ncbi:DUF1553 domain-containing protein [Larkinella rosea]|uniref:DUF1553 domain-containing protein n=1 Tax=Larkinella rosea TaxID=2025312 RepID=A0A3P1BZW5_9BACT|nr:DUF1553 domain-containing protein [Larkinella rosea]RRB06552.1 DUF1553 domain-containing protein [Larkinella rosea]
MKTIGIWGILAVVSLASCQTNQLPQDVQLALEKTPETVDYNLHVKPIISDRCFKCHGPDKAKIEAGLQLANFEGATLENKEGRRAIVPGNVGKSELVKRILSHDPDEVMPTPKSNLTLTADEKAILIKWIEQGAEYKEHWSLTKIEKPDVPKVGQSFLSRWGITSDVETDWVRNEIDRFTLAKMKELGLKPCPQAEKATLLRRIYMDLTGLPPTPAEVEAFEKNTAPNAYEQVVDKLQASPHYGEQQAVSWLDLARFADSQGYQDDPMRNAFPYRDWVIKSFNQNLPFDQFVINQIAGDLLPVSPNPQVQREKILATAFNRLHSQSGENGIIPEEYRIEYVADRANTFGKAFLGLTMECARCHDHKYDPISQKDYYSLFAFFNQNKEAGQITHNGEACPTVMLPTAQTEQTLKFIRTKIQHLQTRLQPKLYETAFTQWARQPTTVSTLNRGLLVHLPLDGEGTTGYENRGDNSFTAFVTGDKERKPLPTAGKIGNAIALKGECGIGILSETVDRINGKLVESPKRFGKGLNFERNQEFSVSVWINPAKAGVEGAIFRRTNYENEGYRGYSVKLNPDQTLTVLLSYVWPANCIELRTTDKLRLNRWQNLTLTYDGGAKAAGVRFFVDGKPARMNVITDNLTKGLLHGEFNSNKQGKFYGFELGYDAREKTLQDVSLDELRIYNRRLSVLEVQSLSGNTDRITPVLQLPASQRTAQQQQNLLEHYLLTADSTFAQTNRQLSAVRGQEVAVLSDIPEVMVMQELPASQQRKSFVLNRGVYDAPGAEVSSQTPLRLGKLPTDYPQNRLGLAQWLLAEDHPLFARVMVNRLWLNYFGNGIVKTQEDFGSQGDLPSHPELLDWLAVQFREENWDTKRFIKRMVMSATYQQSSKATPEEIERDPDNKWLARGSSYRFSAEQVRDNALAASGLLVQKIGGPSVYPYQPAGIWEALATRNTISYRQQHGDSLYRRSMYTIWKRTSPPPMMLNFDSPDRSLCTVRRQKTATPLQALVTLNDPQFVEAARVLAQRTMRSKANPNERIRYFFQSIVSRNPRASELALMNELYGVAYQGFIKSPKRAESLLKTGEYARDPGLKSPELAAYTIVANTILNYDEATIKR